MVVQCNLFLLNLIHGQLLRSTSRVNLSSSSRVRLGNSLLSYELDLLFTNVNKLSEGTDQACEVCQGPEASPLVGQPVEIRVLQKLDFGEDNQHVEDPVEEQRNSLDQS